MRIIFIALLTLLFSCGEDTAVKNADIIRSSNIYLSNYECDSAISTLLTSGMDNTNVDYAKTLASAYACKAGISIPDFFSSDISNVSSPAPLGGMSTFSTSKLMTTYDSVEFTSMLNALESLYYAGGIQSGINPSVTKRAGLLSSTDAAEVNAQALYFTMITLGMYMNHYANTSDAGLKGDGSYSNSCFFNYDQTIPVAVVGTLEVYLGLGNSGSCNESSTGHPDLGTSDNPEVERMCQGVVLLNAMIDLLPDVLANATDTDDLDSVESLLDDIDPLIEALNIAAGDVDMNNILQVQDIDRCVLENSDDTTALQLYMAFLMESIIL